LLEGREEEIPNERKANHSQGKGKNVPSSKKSKNTRQPHGEEKKLLTRTLGRKKKRRENPFYPPGGGDVLFTCRERGSSKGEGSLSCEKDF